MTNQVFGQMDTICYSKFISICILIEISANMKSSNGMNLAQFVSNIPVRKKLIDQNDRDKFEWNQWQSATKSMNNIESPVKEKHVRNLILGTYRLEGSKLFWSMVVRIQIESHPIISWKFSYLTHRLLRDGHKNAISDTILLINYFEQLTKYWSGLQQQYGLLTYRYCHLLIFKLKFHRQYSIFNGNLTFCDSTQTIQTLFQSNSNSYIELIKEFFEYLEEILNLVQIIFVSLDQSRTNSMTTTGQCRLNPLIICIQDSSIIYDYLVKIMFKLHENVKNEMLQSYRERLDEQFRRLKKFYNQVSKLQYFKSLIQVPNLPENPPNFARKDDLKQHQTTLAIVHSAAQMTDNLLVDLSDNSLGRLTGSIDLENRPKEISDLEQRLIQYDTMLKQNRSETDDLHRTIAARDAELLTEKNQRLQLEEQLRQQIGNQKRLEEMHVIEHQTNSDEKFNQLRQEHLAVLQRENDLQQKLTDLNQQLNKIKDEEKKKENQFYENSQKLNEEIHQLRQTNDELQDRIQILTTERNDYQSLNEKIEQDKQNVEKRYQELDQNKSLAEKQLKQIEGSKQNLVVKNRENEEDLIDLIHEREVLEEKLLDYEQLNRNLIEKQKLLAINHENIINNINKQYKHSILTHCINQLHEAIERKNDVKIPTNIDYRKLVIQNTKNLNELWNKLSQSSENDSLGAFLNECLSLTSNMINLIRTNDCQDLINVCIDLFTSYQNGSMNIEKKSQEFLERLKK